jgi:DNA-binding MarR family transcriptional regulator
MADVSRAAKSFTPKQGQYLAFIHLTRVCTAGRQPKPTCRNICISPPSVHQMVLTLERAGFIRRQPRVARSIEMLVDPKRLPELL